MKQNNFSSRAPIKKKKLQPCEECGTRLAKNGSLCPRCNDIINRFEPMFTFDITEPDHVNKNDFKAHKLHTEIQNELPYSPPEDLSQYMPY